MIDEVHYSFKSGDEGIKGKNWDEKEIAVDIIEHLLKEITVYFHIKDESDRFHH
jgi:phosphoribosyl 1,2-cyclic phosphodiesterase